MSSQTPLRFVTFLAPNILPVYQFITHYIGDRLGLTTELLVGDRHDAFVTLQPDIAFICGLPYVLMSDQAQPMPIELLAAPVLEGNRFAGKPIYYSDVIVKHDAPFSSFADLRGRSWAYNEKVSQSGYGITRHHLLTMGETKQYFSEVIKAGWHQRAIQMVAAGEVDAAAIDCQVLAVEMRNQPQLSQQIKIVDALGPSTIQPVVARADLPTALKQEIKEILFEIGNNPAARPILSQGCFDRFVNIHDSDYDDIRAMVRAAEAAQFLTIR
jgi:phosphonate transport system substrate-binding protein